MKKTISHTIGQWILDRTAYGKAANDYEKIQQKKHAQDTAPAKYNHATEMFVEALIDAGFQPSGVQNLPSFEIRSFEMTDKGIQVWIHKAGDLFRVYAHVNDNNMTSLLKTLTEPDFRIDLAKGALDRAVKRINEKVAIANGAVDLVVTNFATPEQEIEFLEDCVIRASKQLLLAE